MPYMMFFILAEIKQKGLEREKDLKIKFIKEILLLNEQPKL